MIPHDFHIEIANWRDDTDRDACMAVREQVFVVEQAVPREDERDEFDDSARHVLARNAAGDPIGTGRLTSNAVIGRMAVRADWRGKQVGAAMLEVLLEQARSLAYASVQLHAQTHAVAFYEKFGFEKFGDEFVECGIAHFHMRRELPPIDLPQRSSAPAKADVRSVAIQSREQALAETLLLVNDAKRDLFIYTRDLDASLFDTEPMLEALKRLAISDRGASIRIIVQEPKKPASNGHRLIALAQRLPSVFAVRTPAQNDDLQYPSAFVINDTRGYYFRVLGHRFDGEAVNYAPGRHAQLLEYFNQVWERCEPSEELRQLAL